MTEAELEILRPKLRIEVLQMMVRALYSGLANTFPGYAKGVREKFSDLQQNHSKIALLGVLPEYSDMVSAEYQEILADVILDIESGFREPS